MRFVVVSANMDQKMPVTGNAADTTATVNTADSDKNRKLYKQMMNVMYTPIASNPYTLNWAQSMRSLVFSINVETFIGV